MKFNALILDLHNTIYDEVMEYGLAIDAAISELPAPREVLYKELTEAHAKLGSDWDDDAWGMCPSLASVSKDVINTAIAKRIAKSKELVIGGAFDGAVDALKTLAARGIKIFVLSEAAADVGMNAIDWLGLAGVVQGVYTYPSRHSVPVLAGTFNKPFAGKKPDAALLKMVIADNGLDAAKTLYVGDSKFKDGLMAQNAGIKFGWAAYGKKVKPEALTDFERSKQIMYAVTGWDKDTLKLTQEAALDPKINALKPDYVFENSLNEALDLF
jgi:phosphoglycolate phosphatase-like HAD superfamily hydrolase